jgi:hypothetical protein
VIDEQIADLRAEDARAVRARAGNAPTLDPVLAARARHRTAYRGLDMLAVYVKARRELLFDQFRRFWREQERAGTWDRLERLAARRLDDAKERRRAAERLEKARRELEAAQRDERDAAERAQRAAAELATVRDGDRRPRFAAADGEVPVID